MRDSEDMPVLRPVAELDYYHQSRVDLPRPMTALAVWNIITAGASPMLRLAFRIRDAVSAPFGVRKIGGFGGRQMTKVNVGDHLDFFLVEEAESELLALTARDRHLDVMASISTRNGALRITSSVVTHNAFGRAYMVPVGLAHPLIVRTMLARLQRSEHPA